MIYTKKFIVFLYMSMGMNALIGMKHPNQDSQNHKKRKHEGSHYKESVRIYKVVEPAFNSKPLKTDVPLNQNFYTTFSSLSIFFNFDINNK